MGRSHRAVIAIAATAAAPSQARTPQSSNPSSNTWMFKPWIYTGDQHSMCATGFHVRGTNPQEASWSWTCATPTSDLRRQP